MTRMFELNDETLIKIVEIKPAFVRIWKGNVESKELINIGTFTFDKSIVQQLSIFATMVDTFFVETVG